MSLAIIIVHYHTPDLLMLAVQALLHDIDLGGLDAEIIVIDNGSSADDKTLFQQLPIKYIDSGSNLGYSRGINLGVENTDSDILMFMNADVMIHEGCLRELCKALSGRVGAVGPRFYWDARGTVMLPPTERFTRLDEVIRRLAGYSHFSKLAQKRWRKHARYHWTALQPIKSYALSGAMLATRRDVWEQIGGFDEQYMLYFEENDWLRRLESHKYSAQYIPDATAHHIYNQSAVNEPKAQQWFAESSERFKQQYYGRLVWKLIKRLPMQQPSIPIPKAIDTDRPQIKLRFTTPPRYPIWIEISPSVLGFPAGGVVIRDTAQTVWELDVNIWNDLMPATYYLQIVDDTGQNLERFSFVKTGS